MKAMTLSSNESHGHGHGMRYRHPPKSNPILGTNGASNSASNSKKRLDVIGAFNQQDDYEKNRNYWKYLKAKLRKENSELVSANTQLKLKAADGKRYNTVLAKHE